MVFKVSDIFLDLFFLFILIGLFRNYDKFILIFNYLSVGKELMFI